MTNKIKSIGADILQKIGQPLNDALKDFEKKFITDENIEKVKDFSRNLLPMLETAIAGIKSFATGLSSVLGYMRTIAAIGSFGLSEGDFLGLKAMGLRSANDFKSSGGSHLIVTPQGKTLQTNPNDTVMGSTKVNDFVSGNEGSMPLGANMKDTNQRLDKLNQNIETLVNLTRGNAGKIIDGIGGLT